MKDRMPEFSPWPDGTIARPTAIERKAVYYHHFHDTLDSNCRACAWEDTI